MPVVVRKRSGSKPYKVVEKSTGKIKSSHTTRKKAMGSASIRNRAVSRKR